MDVVRPRWSSWSLLVYAGGLTFTLAAGGWLAYLSSKSGAAADTGWALLIFAILACIAEWLRRTGHPVTAGVFAFGAVGAFVAFVGELWKWLGWHTSEQSFAGFHLARLVLELVWIVAAVAALKRFRFPLIVLQLVLAIWLFVTDLISNGGNWTVIVSILVGLAYLMAAGGVDRAYGFWLHVAAGLLIGGSILWWCRHGGTTTWILVTIAACIYVYLARVFNRSSWAVLGAIGVFLAADHFTFAWSNFHVLFFGDGTGPSRPWVAPLVFTCAGALLVLLGLWISRPRRAAAG